ncbi:MAG TPA: hypothetical protein VFX94_05230 [Burkholderiales bacterium]|nr:hypothetical protein [Burkholderiales bacterium]
MGVIQRLVGVLLGLLFLAAVLVFASLALGVLIAVGLVIWGWLWWRTRSIRRASGRGVVIEGEYRDVTRSQRIERREGPFR